MKSIYVVLLTVFVLLLHYASPTHAPDTKISSPQNKLLRGMRTRFISRLVSLLKTVDLKEQILVKKETNFVLCLACKFGVGFLERYVKHGATEDDVGGLVYHVCSIFHIETKRVCKGIAELFKTMVTESLMKTPMNPREVCNFGFVGCGKSVNGRFNWTVPSSSIPKPPVKPIPPPKPGSPTLRVLQISDLHIDPYYKEGSNADCGEPLCCRPTSGRYVTPKATAGYWGDYRYSHCDVPLRLVENMLDHINRTHKVDYILWTGDVPPHDLWNTSRTEVLRLLRQTDKLIQKYLGHVPVFPALGNHESSPVESFPIPEIKGKESIDWLYSTVAKEWTEWIPSGYDTIRYGAYYTALVQPGLRIISLNMNYCSALNFWLFINSTDPTGQLEWLVGQLQKAENVGEKVHIIGHIPPGQIDCLAVWSDNYYKIINRYESTVMAQFFAHTHFDEFEVFYDRGASPPRPSSIAYVGPSVTTYMGVNPGYRIYVVDGNYANSSRVVLDHETYFLNLTEANLGTSPRWQLEYTARADFNMTSLLPQEWDQLVDRMQRDDKLFNKYYRFYRRLVDLPGKKCDSTCKKSYLCQLRRAQSNVPPVC